MVTFVEVPPSITEERFTRLVVELANSGLLTSVLLRIPGVRLVAQIDTSNRVIPGTPVTHVPIEHWPELQELQKQLRADLAALRQDKLDGRNLRRLVAAAAKMEITPKYLVDSNGKLVSTYRYMPDGPGAAIAYGTLLIADQGRPFRRDLKQCRLEGCGRFFFSSDSPAATGRDRTRFCSPEHMAAHHRSTSAERVRRFRAKHK